ncbi:MAG: carboxypeptidase-like regulatory domain-containing protein [Gemmatimonadaceae bacterium]
MRLRPLLSFLGLVAFPLRAQTIEGVLQSTDRTPIGDARIFLITPRGYAADTAHTNPRGEFSLNAGQPGRYALSIRRLGYAPERTPYFTLIEGQVKRDTIVAAFTQLLRPIAVVVRDEVKRTIGIDVSTLGKRFLSPEFIDSVRVSAKGLPDFIHRASVPGTWIQNEGTDGICYKVQMQSGCAQLWLDGVKVESAIEISPLDIESIVMLRPNEGFTVTGAAGGSILVYTRRTISRANR